MKPKITPTQLDLWSGNMAELYESLEGEIIRIIIRRIQGGHDDILQWQAEKLADLHLFNREVAKYLAEVTKVAEPEILRMFEGVSEGVIGDIDGAMPYPVKPVASNLDNIMKAYHEQVWSDINNYINQTLITTQYGAGTATRAYQEVLNKTAASVNTGLMTFEQAVEKSITDLAQKGIQSTFRDRGGNTWDLERYSRTVLKSTMNNTYNELRTERMADYDVHTVVVTSHAGAREACSAIQGHVVDLRGPHEIPEGSEYKSIYDPYWDAEYGLPGGHRGVNCKHLHIPFIPGANTNNQPAFDDELNEEVRKNRDTQRRIEREIVKYKKNLMVAEELGSDRADYWKMMVRRRQAAMREHLDSNGKYLRRNYRREKVYTPLSILVKDFTYYD